MPNPTEQIELLSDDALREIEARDTCDHGCAMLTTTERDTLCQTVRALRAEREKAIGLLSPSIPRTDLCDAARQIVFAHALEKGNAEKLQEKNTALHQRLAQGPRSRCCKSEVWYYCKKCQESCEVTDEPQH